MKTIEVQHAEVNTAVVTLKTLTISKKQVTLAVFRQLPEEPLICFEGKLMGVPWGRVNYHPGKCREGDHIHVVWQKGNELRRASEFRPPRRLVLNDDLVPSADDWLSCALAAGWRFKEPESVVNSPRRVPWGTATTSVSFHGAVVQITIHEHHRAWLVGARDTMQYKDGSSIRVGGDQPYLLADACRRVPTRDRSQCEVDVIEEIRAATRVHGACKQAYDSLLELPQLFIAV